MTKNELCLRALKRADHFLKAAQGYSPKRNTRRVQIERRIVHIREKLAEVQYVLTVVENKQ